MSTQVTLTLPDKTHDRAMHLAQLTGRDLADVLLDVLDISLQPNGSNVGKPVSALSDAEVMAVAESQMEPDQDRRFSELLDRQQSGMLAEDERPELLELMQAYQAGLLRKAQALNEAVRRGLREPM